MSRAAYRTLFGGAVAIVSLVLVPFATDPPKALADDDDLRELLKRRPHFTTALTNEDTVPLVDDKGFSGKAIASLVLEKGELKLRYSLASNMDLNAGFPQTDSVEDDVTKIHLHNAPPGIAGEHVLNVYKLPAQDDDDVIVKPNTGIVRGLWDDADLSDGLTGDPASKPLSDYLDELCASDIYVNVHGTGDQGTGALRGNYEPTRQGRRVCRALDGLDDDDDD